jgi:aquaporin Z
MSHRTASGTHWPEYLMEAFGLGLFMIVAGVCAVLLEHPSFPLHQAVADGFIRRMLMGLAMGLTAISLIYSPWGKQSGAHYNPAVTLTFLRLGKVARGDALAYVIAQFCGGLAGMAAVTAVLDRWLAHPAVNFVATVPGAFGTGVAFLAEAVIAFLLMTVVLTASNSPRFARFTGMLAGTCVALFITFEAPLSGMSLNPARTFASAAAAGDWTALWVYFAAPPLGMLAAAAVYQALHGRGSAGCAKLHHQNSRRCIFCEHQQAVKLQEPTSKHQRSFKSKDPNAG